MRKIGLIGGMSWESTLEYYRLINEEVNRRLGGFHSAECLLYSVDFGPIEAWMRDDEWDLIAESLITAARTLEVAGADLLLLCTNTMHKLYDRIRDAVGLELLHIADAAADEILSAGMRTVGLLGTRPTMEQDFYLRRLGERGLRVLVPDEGDREVVHRVIFDELCSGILNGESRTRYRVIIDRLAAMGAEGIVLGCTEIPLLVKPTDAAVPLFDTTRIHAMKAVERALGG